MQLHDMYTPLRALEFAWEHLESPSKSVTVLPSPSLLFGLLSLDIHGGKERITWIGDPHRCCEAYCAFTVDHRVLFDSSEPFNL